MKKLLTLILILFAAPSLCFGESYFCIGEGATGFVSNENYRQTKFETNKWIVKQYPKTGPRQDIAYKLLLADVDAKDLTKDKWILNCNKKDQNKYYIDCGGRELSFHLNKETLRFIYLDAGNFLYSEKTREAITADSIMEIGNCSRI